MKSLKKLFPSLTCNKNQHNFQKNSQYNSHRGKAVHRNTCANGIEARDAIIFHSADIFNKNTDSQALMSQSVENATSPRKVLGSSLVHSLLFDHNLGNSASRERIGRKSPQ